MNALAHVPRKQHQMGAAVIRTAFVQASRDEAVAQWRETANRLRDRFPKLGELMDDAEADVLAQAAYHSEARNAATVHDLPERALAADIKH
jgi:transposase-like protein